MIVDPDNPLAMEIRQEMAETYFAACKKMVAALEALKAFDLAGASAQSRGEPGTRRSELLADACELVYFAVIQREAMQLPCLGGFFDDYEISYEVRTKMGPRPPSQGDSSEPTGFTPSIY